MTVPPRDDDDLVLAELREALATPAVVPPDFLVAGRAAFTWRTVDTDLLLAELTFDSAYDELLATRSAPAGSTRLMVFDGAGYRVEAQVSDAGIVGQVTPVDGARVSCQRAAGTYAEATVDETTVDETTVDEVGCFVLRAPASGAIRLHIRTERHEVVTSWVCLP